MATLRSGRKVDANANIKHDDKAPEKVIEDAKNKPTKDKTTVVIFVGLLLDLLGKYYTHSNTHTIVT